MKKSNQTFLKLTVIVIISICIAVLTFGQAPSKLNYQAVLRDPSGTVLSSADVSIEVQILQGSETGTSVFSEIHSTTTNSVGLVNLELGSANPIEFESIDWSSGPYFIQIFVDGTEMGTSQLLSVPYALYASQTNNVDDADPTNEFQTLELTGSELSISGDDGNTVEFNDWDTDANDDVTINGNQSIAGNKTFTGTVSVNTPVNSADAVNKAYVDIAAADAWRLLGNAGTDPEVNYLGTTDNNPIVFRTNNERKMVLNQRGNLAFENTGNSIFIGEKAGENDDLDYNANVFIGNSAGAGNTTGGLNTAVGYLSMEINNTGEYNTAVGSFALDSNWSGNYNTAVGSYSLTHNTIGEHNTSVGYASLYHSYIGSHNTAMGSRALEHNSTGNYNTASGYAALRFNNSGSNNTANGRGALLTNTTGKSNSAFGQRALPNNTTGSYNLGAGSAALSYNTTGNNNTAYGYNALSFNDTGNNNTAVGYYAGVGLLSPDLENTGAFGYMAQVTTSNTIQIGNTDVELIGGEVGWSITSDGRFKTNVKNNVPGLDFITKLRPVTFNWDLHKMNEFMGIPDSIYTQNPSQEKARQEKEKKVFTGFIAQEVEEAAQQCNYDFSAITKPVNENSRYRLSYAEFVVPLVKAVQEQQVIIEELMKKTDEQQTIINTLLKELGRLDLNK